MLRQRALDEEVARLLLQVRKMIAHSAQYTYRQILRMIDKVGR